MHSSAHAQEIRKKLKEAALRSKHDLIRRHPKTLSQSIGLNIFKLRENSAKLLGAGVVGGSLLLAPISLIKSLPKTHEQMDRLPKPLPPRSPWGELKGFINENLNIPSQIDRSREKQLEKKVQDAYGIPAKVSLEGERLNLVYGLIGIEQHLRRYPGDTISEHGTLAEQREGMAPGLGAWGYFAQSKKDLDQSLIETEKWYVVAQTLYLPDWNTRQPFLKDWYKYRKMIVVNTENGRAVVGAIADAGPAAWTGKHFGGSPEVMRELGGQRYTKGKVLFMFVDDPENKIPLGPVALNDYNNL